MITDREELFESLDFESLNPRSQSPRADVSVSITNRQKQKNSVVFTFRGGVDDLIGDGDRMSFARFKNRIIFAKMQTGAKITTQKAKSTIRIIQFTINEKNEYIKTFVGDYDLKFDELYEYYYINRKEEDK